MDRAQRQLPRSRPALKERTDVPNDTRPVNPLVPPTDGLFVKLEVDWVDHGKIIRAGLEGAGLHAVSLCVAKRLNTDGWIDRVLLNRHGASDALIDRLVELELFDAEADRVRPHGWLDRNPSQAAIAARRDAKRDGARRGNHKRWHDGEFDDCEVCNPKSQVVAGSDRMRSDAIGPPSPESESESESDTPTSTSEQPQVVESLSGPELEQAVNRAVGMVARLRAVNGDNPEALAAHIGRNFPVEDRAELAELIAAGADVADAAAAVADPLRGITASGVRNAPSPEDAEAIRQRARDREQATRDRLAAGGSPDFDGGLAAIRSIRTARSADSDLSGSTPVPVSEGAAPPEGGHVANERRMAGLWQEVGS